MEISRRDRNALKRVGAAAAKAYSATLTPEQRKKRASDAAKARWAKARAEDASRQAATDADLCRHGLLMCKTCDRAFLRAAARAKERGE